MSGLLVPARTTTLVAVLKPEKQKKSKTWFPHVFPMMLFTHHPSPPAAGSECSPVHSVHQGFLVHVFVPQRRSHRWRGCRGRSSSPWQTDPSPEQEVTSGQRLSVQCYVVPVNLCPRVSSPSVVRLMKLCLDFLSIRNWRIKHINMSKTHNASLWGRVI